MDIRPIRREELEVFANFSEQADLNEHFLNYLRDMWDEGYVRPEWCFVAEEAGEFVGRIVYWSLPSLGKPFICDFLELPWNANYLAVGTQLLQQSLTQLQLHDSDSMEYQLDIPSPYSTYLEKRIELLEKFGFSLNRETIRFEWKDTQTQITLSNRLTFRSLNQVGEDAFIHGIMQVSSQTLDRSILHDQAKLGLEQEALERFHTSKALKYNPTWWQLAYTQDETLVGLIMPAENDGGAIIGFIGVVPEHRGQGYVNDLLQQGTLTLKSNGAVRIRSDADTVNVPMVHAFQRAGYRQFASRREYRYSMK
ncbi:GNAT family N-acetyltransferase [Brasilonema octagenarum UFV-E1]|uniref:GNAT family N-acetyltransferase n=2 Tax=Brasilonema TaxID=383614 RepID=A0A856MKN6_9CYAN|nr:MULTISPECIES: GNAT family N-acetyltransferase [Brasilonema]NMF62752.1 GNAT family N-acetyltransferase [Brasilonema octagenarum UFV-OR1]QDL10131.1 GNAT family N-acetyltransferase [Brasilonema sennae CENA114]QDL16484.1 GNAT family N-acetyltransferase [Brasilonema octagenarum UFV-E1]